MAKTPTPPPAPKAPGTAPTPVVAPHTTFGKYTIGKRVPLPVMTRGSRGDGQPNELAQAIMNLAAPDAAGVDYVLEPITIPETITDAKEREKAFNEQAKTLTNRLGSTVKRVKKQTAHALKNFSIRKVNDDTYGVGVAVFRVEDSKPAEGPATA